MTAQGGPDPRDDLLRLLIEALTAPVQDGAYTGLKGGTRARDAVNHWLSSALVRVTIAEALFAGRGWTHDDGPQPIAISAWEPTREQAWQTALAEAEQVQHALTRSPA